MEDNKRPAMVSMAGLKSRGWTGSIIQTFLQTPDREAPNPHYRSAAPMKLYFLWRIEAIESTPEWKALSDKAAKKSESSKKAAESKKHDLLHELQHLKVAIPKLQRHELTKQACRHYNTLALERDKEFSADSSSDRSFLDRITVNYLRHEMSVYESSLDDVYRKIGADEARMKIRKKVYEAIAETYPDLAAECKRQFELRNSMAMMGSR